MELPFKELTHMIIGCAMEVHRVMGPGFQEYIYQRALAIELKASVVNFQEEYEIPIFYKGEKIGLRRGDFGYGNAGVVSRKYWAPGVRAFVRARTCVAGSAGKSASFDQEESVIEPFQSTE